MNAHAWEPVIAPLAVTAPAKADWGVDLQPTASYLPAQTLSSTQATVLAQQFDQDILGDLGNAWNTFIESGQVWALIIGLVLGYMIRGLTAY